MCMNGRVIHVKSKRLRDWRQAIAAHYAGDVLDGPVSVSLDFRIPRPKTVSRESPSVRPDLDKLVRAVLDALTGRAWADDGQVVQLTASKNYGTDSVGVLVKVRPL